MYHMCQDCQKQEIKTDKHNTQTKEASASCSYILQLSFFGKVVA